MGLFRVGTIRSRLFIGLCGVIIAVTVMGALVWGLTIEPALRRSVAQEQQEVATRAADQIASFMEHQIVQLAAVSELGQFWREHGRRKEMLDRLLKLAPSVQEVALADRQGRVVARLSRVRVFPGADLGSIAQKRTFQEGMKGHNSIGDVYQPRTAEPMVTVAVPVRFTPTEVAGVVTAEINLKTLWDAISEIKLGQSGSGFVVDGHGRVIAHPDYSKVLLGITLAGHPAVKEALAHPGRHYDRGKIVVGQDGRNVMTTYAIVPGPEWVVIVEEPAEAALEGVRRVERLALLLAALALVGSFGLSSWFCGRIARPIRQLTEGAARVARGDLEHRLEIVTGDEIETLATQFNEMAGRLRVSHDDLLRQVGEKTRDLSALYTLITPLGAADHLGAMLDEVLARIVEITDADGGLIQVLGPETKRFLVSVTPALAETAAQVDSASVRGEGLLARSLATGEPVIIGDVHHDPNIRETRIVPSGFRSAVLLPFNALGEDLGTVVLVSDRAAAFNPDHVEFFAAISRQVALALDNARLHEGIREKLAQTETLLAVSQEITVTLDTTAMMRRVAREAGRALGADMVGAFLADAEQRYLRPIAGYHVPKHLLGDFMAFAIPLKGHPILEEAWEHRRLVWSSDVGADPRVDQDAFGRFPHRSNLFCPLIVQEEPIGGLFVTWFEQAHRFTPAELQLVEGISRQASIALANARLVEELRTRHARLEALLEITRQLSRIQPVTSLLTSIVQACGQLLGCDSVGIRLVEGDELVLAAAWGDANAIMNKRRLKIGESLSGRVAATGEAFVVVNPDEDPRVIPEHREQLRRLGYRAWLGVPVQLGDRLVGVLVIQTKRAEGFSAEDLTTVTAFAAQAAVALGNTRLYQELQHAYDELKQTQDQLTQAQRMEAVGRLAGGVAHDFNNLLTVITGSSFLLLARLAPDAPERSKIELIRATADRAAALTRQLLAFSRKQILRPTILDVTAVVTGLTPMLQRLVGEDVAFAILPGSSVGRVLADQGQLEQVLANLVVNARDAMPRGGRLTIRTANANLNAAFVSRHPEVRAGAYVTLEVSDTGTGMSPDVQARVFEPFFTTKEVGKGTGLGLSTVYGIIRQHEGYIFVESELGRGSTFKIYLPRVEESTDSAHAAARPAEAPRGTETILLVEDEAEVRELAREALEMNGYRVLEAGNGSDAVRIADGESNRIHLLVTDVVMPGLNGREAAERLKKSHRETRVLYMSGYTDDAIAHHGVLDSGTVLLAKPFTPDELARKVREVLDAR